PSSFISSGLSGIFFLDSATTGIPTCSGQNAAWYCPSPSPDPLTATNMGAHGNQGTVAFSIENADVLFSTSNTAFSTLGGPQPGAFYWGLPFFYGRDGFTHRKS